MISNWKLLKKGSKFTWDGWEASGVCVKKGCVCIVLDINENGRGSIQNFATKDINSWNFDCSDLKYMTLIEEKPYVHVPIKHAYFYHSVGD